jgi:hypothetical protein
MEFIQYSLDKNVGPTVVEWANIFAGTAEREREREGGGRL